MVPEAGHDLAEAPEVIDESPPIWPADPSVELPPVLVALEEITDGVR